MKTWMTGAMDFWGRNFSAARVVYEETASFKAFSVVTVLLNDFEERMLFVSGATTSRAMHGSPRSSLIIQSSYG